MKRAPQPRVVAVIPARYAATRLPGKPLAEIDGKPMIRHVVERVGRAALVSDVIVATDDERVRAAVEAFGGRAVMTPAGIASGTDRVALVAETLKDAGIIVNIQGDEPLIPAAMIDQAIRPLLEDPGIPCGTLVRAVTADADLTNSSVVKVVLDAHGDALYFSRSAIPFLRDVRLMDWLRTHTFYRHIGLYVYRRDFLLKLARLPQTPLEKAEKLEQLRILEAGGRIRATVTTYDSIAVDTPDDLEKVRRMARSA